MAKPEPSPAYLWYPKDVMSSGRVAALSALEELWYRRALDQSWLHSGMPSDPSEFAGWVGRRCTVKAAEKLIEKFFDYRVKNSDKVFNKKQEQLRKELRRKSKERSRAGIESGRKRRERSKLEAEQMLNKTGTKTNIPYSSSSSSFSEPPTPKGEAEVNRNGNGHRPRNQGNNREVDNWLDAIASSLGAKNKNTIADVRGWSDTCAKAIQDGKAVTDLLDAITMEKERNRETPQFFTPKAVLKILQLQSAKTPLKKFDH